jgi:hypothetical protein
MTSFLRSLSGLVLGVLSGFDRLMFRGHLRSLSFRNGMECYRSANGVRYVDFSQHAQALTEQLIAASEARARQLDRPIQYLPSATQRKEELARTLARRDGIHAGLIGIFTCLEPCQTYTVRGNWVTKRLEFRSEFRKCLHLYHYYQHPVFGLLYARLQSWFPFGIQIGINGREWLARQLDAAGVSYRRHENCVYWVEDPDRCQQLFDEQLQVDWPRALNEIQQWVHPSHPELLGRYPVRYYWSLTQSEWASDVLFADRAFLQRRFENWLRFALTSYTSPTVLRFLGGKPPVGGGVGRFAGEVLSDWSRRVDGMRIKHRAGANSIKMYDKVGGAVLRVETTINDPTRFQVYRPQEGDPDGAKAWRPLRRGVADVHRRAEVSQAANERYLDGLAAAAHPEPLKVTTERLARRVAEPGRGRRTLRGLNLLAGPDAALLAVIARPEFVVNGVRNRDVVAGLYPQPTTDPAECQRRSAHVTRLLRLLRAHRLIHKVPRTHLYRVSPSGRIAITAVLAARNATTEQLIALAA